MKKIGFSTWFIFTILNKGTLPERVYEECICLVVLSVSLLILRPGVAKMLTRPDLKIQQIARGLGGHFNTVSSN